MNENKEDVEKILGSITLPPCPAVLLSIMSEVQKEEPDANKVATQVSNDAALSASVLKLVNSPAFRRGSNIGSIRQAVSVLGFRKVMLAVNTLFLRNSVSAVPPITKAFLEKFWDKSASTAEASMMMAGMLPGISAEDAYTIGLFHDCGIPVLIMRFPDHPFETDTQEANWDTVHKYEDERLGTNHAIVGNMFARNWGLPAHICQTILHHHDANIFNDNLQLATAEVRNFTAVLILAEHLADISLHQEDEGAIGKFPIHSRALRHLGLEREEFNDMASDILGELSQGRN